jgi:hypothetical protein
VESRRTDSLRGQKQTDGLVAKGGFQYGQIAKARRDRRVQSLPVGPKPPSALFSLSPHIIKNLNANYHPVRNCSELFSFSPHPFHTCKECFANRVKS